MISESSRQKLVANIEKVAPRGESESYRATRTDDYLTREQVLKQVASVPEHEIEVQGYRVMVLALTMPDKVGLIQIQDSTLEQKSMTAPQGVVLQIGSECYSTDRYASPWCEVGDKVIFAKYPGRSYRLSNGQLLFFLNEDEVFATAGGGFVV